jgi:NAD(P)-dependent dehydrogenase (short-subunit alcohol dehydrogenase family)
MASATVVRDLEGKVALVTGATSGIGRAAPSAVAAAVNVPRSATSRPVQASWAARHSESTKAGKGGGPVRCNSLLCCR